MKLESATGVEHCKLELNKKLSVGVWTVRLKVEEKILADLQFLVLPSRSNSDTFVDSLVERFYSVDDFCSIDGGQLLNNDCSFINAYSRPKSVKQCKFTDWSSYSPDPKSQIDGLDAKNGVLKP